MNTPISFTTVPQNTQLGEYGRIASDPFYPEIDLNHLRTATRIDATVTGERLFQAACEAVIHVNRQLSNLKERSMAAGKTTLAQTQTQQINGQSQAEYRYLQAVYNYTQATLNEQYADYDAAGKTAERAEAKQQNADNYRRNAHAAVADLLGRQRTDAQLI